MPEGERGMTIYGAVFSPYAARTLLVARAKGQDFDFSMPEGGLKSESYLALSPLGKIPLLVDGDVAIPESAVIADYLDETLDGPSLRPADPEARLADTLMARFVDVEVVAGMSLFFRYREREDIAPDFLAKVSAGLRAIAHYQAEGAAWLASDRFGHADAALIPSLAQMDFFDERAGTGRLWREVPSIAAYWARAQQVDFVARTVTAFKEGFAAFMAARAQPKA